MVHSAEMSVGSSGGGILAILTSRHAMFAMVAVVVMLIASRINIRHAMNTPMIANPVLWALGVSLVLCGLTFVPEISGRINGARRWVKIGSLMFQPSELVKWIMIIALAWWCARRVDGVRRFWSGLVPALALVAVACALIVIEDLGTAALVATISMIVLLAGGARWWQMGMMFPPAAAALVVAVIQSPYRVARLTTFMHPYEDPEGRGYQAIQSMLAIANGGVSGRGIGNGVQKHGYLPADTSDFIFANICAEMGLAGAALVVFLYMTILWCGIGIVRGSRDMFGRLIVMGIVLTVGLQAVINLAVVTVLVPTKGIALPLMSAGGTGWIMTAFALGLVAGLDTSNQIETDDEPDLVLAAAT